MLAAMDSCFGLLQGSYGSWKTYEVMELYNIVFQAWKVMEFECGSWPENDFSENNKARNTLNE